MDIYIDKANFISLMGSHSHMRFEDSLRVIKKQLNVFFNFPKEEFRSDEELLSYYSRFTDGVGEKNKIEFGYRFPGDEIKSTTSNSFNSDQLSSVFLLENPNVEKLKNTGGILIGAVGEEVNIIDRLLFQQDDYRFEKKWRIGGDTFNKWEDLSGHVLPLSDIIIIDAFITSDKSLVETNLGSLLRSLCKNVKSKVNIVLFTDRTKTLPYDDISSVVRKHVKYITGVGPNFTLVTYVKQRGVDSLDEHDRTIFSNYLRIYSGDTFNYFNSAGKVITKGREIQFSSLAEKENYELSKLLVTEIQTKIDFLKSQEHGIQGDKKSGYLTF